MMNSSLCCAETTAFEWVEEVSGMHWGKRITVSAQQE